MMNNDYSSFLKKEVIQGIFTAANQENGEVARKKMEGVLLYVKGVVPMDFEGDDERGNQKRDQRQTGEQAQENQRGANGLGKNGQAHRHITANTQGIWKIGTLPPEQQTHKLEGTPVPSHKGAKSDAQHQGGDVGVQDATGAEKNRR